MHLLQLIYPKCVSCHQLTIQDGSLYDPDVAIKNVILEIKAPGKDCFKKFQLQALWCSKTFGASDLDLFCSGADNECLPDGNYELKYSLDPNLTTMVEFNHFRVCKLMSNLVKKICLFEASMHSMSLKRQKFENEKFFEIQELIKRAVWMAEECLNIDKAIELYNEANSKLKGNNYDCPTC